MEDLIPYLIVFALGFAVGYGAREWKSRMRRQRYTRDRYTRQDRQKKGRPTERP
jgi:hypothetical protein